ncbi:MAG: hypothetical protein DWQ37_23675 [Planctomycetota bacterium]|mgnify:CR=1 FL=1|nr:MAG: hypothetical protein DWQ37_23675 [Planctomycetota bacterium]
MSTRYTATTIARLLRAGLDLTSDTCSRTSDRKDLIERFEDMAAAFHETTDARLHNYADFLCDVAAELEGEEVTR